MRVIYLRHSLSLNGRSSLSGRKLIDELDKVSQACMVTHIIMKEENAIDVHPDLVEDILPETKLLDFDPTVIISEGGFFSSGTDWKMSEPLARRFVEDGGVFIVADVDVNILRQQRTEYASVADFLGARADYCGQEPVLGYDKVNYWEGTKQIICKTDDMVVSDWLMPVYEGVPEIIVGLPVRLGGFSNILASGNQHSTWSNATDGIPGPDNMPFATVKKIGHGFVVYIAGNVTGDVWLEGCPHNTKWLTNVAQFLSSEAERDKLRTGQLGSDTTFLSHAHEDKQLVSEVFESLTRDHLVGGWIDQDGLIVGDSLTEGIIEAISKASYVTVFWSEATVKSEWVRLEVEWAKQHGKPLIIIRLDDSSIPQELAGLLRIEAALLTPQEIAEGVRKTLKRRSRRGEISRIRERTKKIQKEKEKNKVHVEPLPEGASLTRKPGEQVQALDKINILEGLPEPKLVSSIKSNYRIDLLSYLDGQDLIVGSSSFDMESVEKAKSERCFRDFSIENVQTGMDGHFDDHIPTRRHLQYGYEDINIFDRNEGEVIKSIECDSAASVMTAAWSPDGTRLIVGSTNYLTVATDKGDRLLHKNLWRARENNSPKSVVWQPSYYPVFASGKRVCIANQDGQIVRELSDHTDMVVCVAVSPCQKMIAASSMDGQTIIWSETGEMLATFKGFGSTAWHARRCLSFSPDSRWLCQCASTDSDGFIVLDLLSGCVTRVMQKNTSRVAFHPLKPNLLATIQDDQVMFWEINTKE